MAVVVVVVAVVAVEGGAVAIDRALVPMVRVYARSVDIECRIKWASPVIL